MEKTFKINCEWCSSNDKPDVSGHTENSWSGTIRVKDDGRTIGVVKDFGHEHITHLVVGVYLTDIGMTLIKFPVDDTRYDAIGFTGTIDGESKSIVGEYSAITPFRIYPMGYFKSTLDETKLSEEKSQELNSLIEEAQEIVNRDMFKAELALNNGENANIGKITAQLKRLLEIKLANPYNTNPYIKK